MSVNKIAGTIAVIAALLPWVSFGLLPLDTQPWSLIAFSVFLMTCSRGLILPRFFAPTSAWTIIGILMGLLASTNPLSFLSMRAVANYASVFIVFLGYYVFIRRYGHPIRIILTINLVWLLAGFVEIFAPELIAVFSPIRTTENRGVTSLAPEPTFFALYLFFSSWLLSAIYQYRPPKRIIILIFVNFSCIVLLAKSTMGLLIIVLSIFVCGIYLLGKTKVNKTGAAIFSVTLISFLMMLAILPTVLPDSRLVQIIQRLSNLEMLGLIFFFDASMNERLEHVVLPFHGALHNYLVPGGFDTFAQTRSEIIYVYNDFFWYSSGRDKIMSWLGDWVFQLGLFGIVTVFLLFSGAADGRRLRRFELVTIVLVLLSATPLGFPLPAMLLAQFYSSRIVVQNFTNSFMPSNEKPSRLLK